MGALQGVGHFSGMGLGSRRRRSKGDRLYVKGAEGSGKAGSPEGYDWED